MGRERGFSFWGANGGFNYCVCLCIVWKEEFIAWHGVYGAQVGLGSEAEAEVLLWYVCVCVVGHSQIKFYFITFRFPRACFIYVCLLASGREEELCL